MDEVLLPAEALARWRAIVPPSPAAEPGERVVAWIAGLRARMLVSGGRLARMLVGLGRCEIETIVECLHAQIDAGWPSIGALEYDVSSDLFAVASRASLDSLARLSARLAELDASAGNFDALHVALAGRLFDEGREREAEAVLARVDWHLPLLRLLESRAAALSPGLRERLLVRTGRLIETSHLPVEYHVGLFAWLAVLARDERWLARARECLAQLAPDQLECTPDYPHPIEDVAWAQAEFGEFELALATIAELDPRERWTALLRLLPLAHEPATRAAMIEELVAGVEPLELAWAWLLEAAPELGERALARLWAIPDEAARFEELAAAVRHLDRALDEPVCAWMLNHARSLAPDDERRARVWSDTLDALRDRGWAAMLDEPARRALIDELLARPELELWDEAAAFVPDDRVNAVFDHAHAELARADHYVDRERWIALALALVDRTSADRVERWRALAVEAMPLTAIDEDSLERLAAWPEDRRAAIVLARLRQHQREFLPGQLIEPWLVWLGWALPPSLLARAPAALERIPSEVRARQLARVAEFTIAVADDEVERARVRGWLDELLARPGWPTHDRVVWVFALLGRCAGEAAIVEALAALA
ncbi:hypothetical protein ACNOYE_30635 [Nannocystaceae bacterium ST9]